MEDTLGILLYLGLHLLGSNNWLSLSFWKTSLSHLGKISGEILDIGGSLECPGSTILVDILSSCHVPGSIPCRTPKVPGGLRLTVLQDPGGYELCLVSLESFDMAIARRTGSKIWLVVMLGVVVIYAILAVSLAEFEYFGHVCHTWSSRSIFPNPCPLFTPGEWKSTYGIPVTQSSAIHSSRKKETSPPSQELCLNIPGLMPLLSQQIRSCDPSILTTTSRK